MSEFTKTNNFTSINTSLTDDELLINQLLSEDLANELAYELSDNYLSQTDSTNCNSNNCNSDNSNINSDNDIDSNNLPSVNQLHLALREMALNTIPEMLIPVNMIILNGEINDLPVKILLDTGASSSVIFKNAMERLELNELIDQEGSAQLIGIGTEQSLGNIWYTELKLENNIYPISLICSSNKISDFDMILGINFLQSYKAVLNFKNKTLLLNDKYEIKFNL
jgi:hypothetical protein